MAACWACRSAASADGAPGLTHCPLCRRSRKGNSRRSRRACCGYPASGWKPRPDGIRWCGALVSCLGDADAIFARLYAQLRELGWVGPHTVVVIVGDGAEWIWNRATLLVRRCEILDFGHALEHAWGVARLLYGEESQRAGRWVHPIAEELRAGQVQEVLARLQRLRPKTPELREKRQGLIAYYSQHRGRMHYDEYLRLGYGIGSGAVESAHKQVVQARFRQAGMRWSEAGARRRLALRWLLLNDQWALLDGLPMNTMARCPAIDP